VRHRLSAPIEIESSGAWKARARPGKYPQSFTIEEMPLHFFAAMFARRNLQVAAIRVDEACLT